MSLHGSHSAGLSPNANPSSNMNRWPWLNLWLALTHPRPPTPAKTLSVFGAATFLSAAHRPKRSSTRQHIAPAGVSPAFPILSSYTARPGHVPFCVRNSAATGLSLPRTCVSRVGIFCFPATSAWSGSMAIMTYVVLLLSPMSRRMTRRTCSGRTSYAVTPLAVRCSRTHRPSPRDLHSNFPRGVLNEICVVDLHTTSLSL